MNVLPTNALTLTKRTGSSGGRTLESPTTPLLAYSYSQGQFARPQQQQQQQRNPRAAQRASAQPPRPQSQQRRHEPQTQQPLQQPSAIAQWMLTLFRKSSIEEWTIPRDQLVIGPKIGSGSFGTVYRGYWHG